MSKGDVVMNEYEDNNKNTEENFETGEIFGFDSATSNESDGDTGYTVTPQGGFYTKKGEEIIQDEITCAHEETNDNRDAEERNQNFNCISNYSYQPPKKSKPPRQKWSHSTGVLVACVILAAVIGAASALGAMAVMFTADTNDTEIITQEQGSTVSNININVDETASSIAEAVAVKATDSVVGIRTTFSVADFFGGSSESTGEGSGVVYTSDGYIITNYHVISDAVSAGSNAKIEVFVGSKEGTSYEAKVVGYNIMTDLAVLKINANGLTALQLGDEDSLKVGQYIVTIGAPGGLDFMGSVTYGIISGLDRIVSTDSSIGLIQIDAAINPGNSGGALLDAEGKLIGINSSKIVSEEYEGMGFAIPVDIVKEKCDKIISRENSPEPYIGITISQRYTSQALAFYGYPAGAVISSVAEDSPAQKAGLRRGDIVTEFNETKISEYTVLSQVLNELDPGDKVTVKIYRDGRYYSTEITIGSNG